MKNAYIKAFFFIIEISTLTINIAEAPVIKTNKPIRDHSRVGLFIFTSNAFTYGMVHLNASK